VKSPELALPPLRPLPRPPGSFPGDARRVPRPRHAPGSSPRWIYALFVFQFACQLFLAFASVGGMRALVRAAAFGISLVFLVMLQGRGRRHPAALSALAVLGITAVNVFHPGTRSFFAGVASVGLYMAVIAPVLWGPRLRMDVSSLRKVVLILWAFHSVSAGFGVLQVYFPGRFQPNLSQAIVAMGENYTEALHITTATGESTLRPMGLTDIPGGASMAGFYAFLLSAGLLLSSRRKLLRLLCVTSMFIGSAAIYLSYVRSVLVLLVVCLIAMLSLLVMRGELKRVFAFSAVTVGMALVGFLLAVTLGGDGVLSRISTLVEDDPSEVYHRNRGRFLEYTLEEVLPNNLLGTGLARWGMVSVYFGDRDMIVTNIEQDIWVEIQWTGWVVDGGLPLMLAYSVSILLALWTAFRIATGRLGAQHRGLWPLAAIVFAYSVGGLALTFNFPFFVSQSGLEFWVLNALLFAVAVSPAPKPAAPRPAPAPRRPAPRSVRA